MRKRVLKNAVLFLSLVGVMLVCWPFVGSLQPNAKAKAELEAHPFELSIDKLEIGVPTEVEVSGRPLIFLKPSDKQLKDLKFLDAHVANPSLDSYIDDVGVFVYQAWGRKNFYYCEVEHRPSEEASEWYPEWKGGFLSMPCDISYDYAGRAIKSVKYSAIGYAGEFENLKSPYPIRVKDGVISIYR